MATYDRHKDNEINQTLKFTSIINQYNIRDIIYQKFDYKLEKLIKSSFIERRENYFIVENFFVHYRGEDYKMENIKI